MWVGILNTLHFEELFSVELIVILQVAIGRYGIIKVIWSLFLYLQDLFFR